MLESTMGYWSQFDEDSTRLPEGFKRIGYDADTATYTYEDSDGNRYEGAPSCEYGVLTKIESSSPARQTYRSSRSNTPHSSFSRGSTLQDFAERSPTEKPHAEKSPVPPPAGAPSPSFGESKENYQSTWSLLSIARLLRRSFTRRGQLQPGPANKYKRASNLPLLEPQTTGILRSSTV